MLKSSDFHILTDDYTANTTTVTCTLPLSHKRYVTSFTGAMDEAIRASFTNYWRYVYGEVRLQLCEIKAQAEMEAAATGHILHETTRRLSELITLLEVPQQLPRVAAIPPPSGDEDSD